MRSFIRNVSINLKCILLGGCLLVLNISKAQHLSIFNVDSKNYPKVQAQFYAFDSLGKQVLNLTKADVKLVENDKVQEVLNINNPIYSKPKAISLVLAADVSGSMLGPNMNIAKVGIRSIINSLPLEYSECALTSFDHNNYINSDFSKDANRLNKATNTLIALGGTDYDVAFNNPLTGALELAREGRYKRVLIFLTDGLGKGNENAIINKALSLGVTVYCITVNMSAPDVLKNVAEKTGGRYFENVSTPEQAKNIYQKILYESQEIKPSTIEWVSEIACNNIKEGRFSAPDITEIKADYNVSIPIENMAQLKSDVRYIESFYPDSDTSITIEAVNNNFEITSVESKLFEMNSPSLPVTIKKGEQLKFILTPKETNESVILDKVFFHNDKCYPLTVSVSVSDKLNTPMQVIRPNGGEVLYYGMDTIISWLGTKNGESIDVELSTNNGVSWDTIFNHVLNSNQYWKIPKMESKQVLVKVTRKEGNTHIKEDSTGKVCDLQFKIRRASFKFSPDKTKLICQDLNAFKNKDITVHDFHTGKVLHTFDGDKTLHASFSADGSKIYLTPRNGGQLIRVFDAHNFQLTEEFPEMKKPVCFNEINTHYLHRVEPKEFNYELIDLRTGKVLLTFNADNFKASSIMNDCAVGFSNTIDHSKCEIWNMKDQKKVFQTDTRMAKLFYKKAYLTKDKKYIVLTGTASESDLDPNFLEIYDVDNKKLIFAETTRGSYSNLVDISSSNRILRVNSHGNLVLQDLATGDIHQMYDRSIFDGDMSKDGKFIVLKAREVKAASYTRGLYKLRVPKDSVEATDISDETFSIIRPDLKSIDVDFGEVITGENKDKVVPLFLNNPHEIDIPVESIYFEGGQDEAFSLVAGNAPFTLKSGQLLDLEFRFSPTQSGINKSTIVVASAYDTIRKSIQGFGASLGYVLATDRINLGKIKVGQSKDSLITSILRNTGQESLKVRFVKIIGPDKQQFSLDIEKDFVLKPGASKSVTLSFNPVLRGRTSSRIFFEVENVIGYQVVEVFGEGMAPKEYVLKGKTLNKLDGSLMPAQVTCTELNSGKKSLIVNTDEAGDFDFQLNADRVYVIKAEKKEFSITIDTIDLRIHSASKIIKKNLILSPPKGSEPVDGHLVVYGKLIDKKSGKPLQGSVNYCDLVTKEKLGEVKADSIDGTYRLVLEYNQSYELVPEVKEYFPVTKTVLSDKVINLKVIKQNFLLTNAMSGETVQLNHVLFVVGQSELLPESFAQLDLLSKFLTDNEHVKIQLSGHTDNSGSAKLNQKLSEARVSTIKKYLIDKGVPKNRISGTGYGGRKPIASNRREETRRLNRRVEFKVVKK